MVVETSVEPFLRLFARISMSSSSDIIVGVEIKKCKGGVCVAAVVDFTGISIVA